MVILAAPVRVIIDMINNRIGSYLRSNTLLIDIGSTKRDICDAMGRLPIGIQAIGGHPMTGKESSGIEESDASAVSGSPVRAVRVAAHDSGDARPGAGAGRGGGRCAD